MPKAIVQGPLVDGKASQSDVVNLVNLLQDDATQEFRKKFRLATIASGTYQTIWSMDMPKSSAWRVTAEVTGRGTSGAGRACYIISGLFYRDLLGSAQQGATVTLLSIESAAAMDAALAAVGNGVTVTVRDEGTLNMRWSALIRCEEI